ncbi:MAG: PTS system mannose/fructose/N-acetylgalactosamine-transporter subunit IIB [Vagococcus sp.]
MNIIGVRIDGRLVHGQVANLWIPKLQIDRVIVVDDRVSESDIEKSGLRLATPAGVTLSVLPVERASKQLLEERYGNQRLFILSRKPQPLLGLIEQGVALDEINIGNMSKGEDTHMITNSISVNKDDVTTFKAIDGHGTKLVSQMVPGTKVESFIDLLAKFEKGEN